jgi:hypothetical protein
MPLRRAAQGPSLPEEPTPRNGRRVGAVDLLRPAEDPPDDSERPREP